MALLIIPFMESFSTVDLNLTGILMSPFHLLCSPPLFMMGLIPQMVAFWADNVVIVGHDENGHDDRRSHFSSVPLS